MKKTALGLALGGLLIASSSAFALECAPDMYLLASTATYKTLYSSLSAADVTAFSNAMNPLSNFSTATDAQYQNLMDLATAKVNATNTTLAVTTARVVVTLPDGTVALDTGKTSNSLTNFKAKSINENHNTRLAILDAQQFPCGFGLETKVSTSVGGMETAVAKRLGSYMNSFGTVRVSFTK